MLNSFKLRNVVIRGLSVDILEEGGSQSFPVPDRSSIDSLLEGWERLPEETYASSIQCFERNETFACPNRGWFGGAADSLSVQFEGSVCCCLVPFGLRNVDHSIGIVLVGAFSATPCSLEGSLDQFSKGRTFLLGKNTSHAPTASQGLESRKDRNRRNLQTHHVKGYSSVKLDCSVQVTKDNGCWRQQHVHWVPDEKWEQLDQLARDHGDQKHPGHYRVVWPEIPEPQVP